MPPSTTAEATSNTSFRRMVYFLQLYAKWYLTIVLVLLVSSPAGAQDPGEPNNILNCSSPLDSYVGNAQDNFQVMEWIKRGLCIRRPLRGPLQDFQCYSRLQFVISRNLNDIRKAEYGGAAGVLALLPTIGALLGTPTNEIWRLLTMIPFGGFLAMACSFGGAILPVKVKDYESDFMRKNISGKLNGRKKSTLTLPTKLNDHDEVQRRADILMDRVQRKLQLELKEKVPKTYILFGLIGMALLLVAAQVAMVIVELGSVLPWWCESKWWVHLWYLMVIVSAAVDNYVQLPFDKQWKLCLSDVPYDVVVTGADNDEIVNHVDGADHQVEGIRIALEQLTTLKTGTVRFANGPQTPTRPRNVLFVMVSVASQSHNWRKTFVRSLSKITSMAVFVVGTACFASAQLLSIAMATFVLTCVLGAGVFGRAITSWIVSGVETANPMVHYVAEKPAEAHYVLARLFTLGMIETGTSLRHVQVELHGQIFLEKKRVAYRSPWPSRFMGILRSPYDMREAVHFKDVDDIDLENLDGYKNGTALPLMESPVMASTLVAEPSSSLSSTGNSISRTSASRVVGAQ